MTVREHLAKAHSFMAEHHREMSKCHGAAMGKAVSGDAMHEFHKNAAMHHDAAAEQHDQMCEECQKAASADLAKTLPTRVCAVTPTAPVRAVVRHGQREIPLTAMVDPEFAKLVQVDEDEERESLR